MLDADKKPDAIVNTTLPSCFLNDTSQLNGLAIPRDTKPSMFRSFTFSVVSAFALKNQSPKVIKALRPKQLFAELIKKINGGFDYPVSSFLLDEWQQVTITSGNALRGIEGATIKTSFSDFFKSINAELFAAVSVENDVVSIERGNNVFRNVTTLEMTDSKEVELSAANDMLINAVKVGYKDQNYDELNSKDEVNSEQRYVIDVLSPQRELDLISEYRADAYGITYLIINLDGRDSTDSESDNDTFFLDITSSVQTSGYYEPLTIEKAGASITGVRAGDSYFNWRLSPARMLRRHGMYIHSLFYNNDGYQLRFTSGDKNTKVSVTEAGSTIQEGSNISMSELDAAFFIPMYAEFVTDLPNDVWKFINNQVYTVGKFKYMGEEMRGYFISLSVDIAKNSERDMKLLLTVDNNLVKLIR